MRNRAAVWAFSALGLLLAFAAFEIATTSGTFAQQKVVPPSREMVQYSFAPIARKASPAVVNVYVRRRVRLSRHLRERSLFRQFFGERFGRPSERVQSSLGSGVIVSPDGTIVTNTHVIKGRGETEIRVALADKREYDARVVVQDEKTDIAILKIEGGDSRFRPSISKIATRSKSAIWYSPSATRSASARPSRPASSPHSPAPKSANPTARSFIQTDAAINPGNSAAHSSICRAASSASTR